jgi:hypothetical protein
LASWNLPKELAAGCQSRKRLGVFLFFFSKKRHESQRKNPLVELKVVHYEQRFQYLNFILEIKILWRRIWTELRTILVENIFLFCSVASAKYFYRLAANLMLNTIKRGSFL